MINKIKLPPPDNGKVRDSNIEALRLLLMLMILNLHSFWGYDHGSGFGQAFDFFRETTSICAVDAFVLVSGFYGIKWKKKSCFSLLFQILFYSFAVYGFCVGFGILAFDKGGLLSCFKCFYDSWGFVTWYLILYFVSPWLNAFVERVDKRSLLIFIVIFFIAENLILRTAGSGSLNFCLLYLIGRWINKTNAVDQLRVNATRGYWITTVILFVIVYALFLKFHFNANTMAGLVIGYSYSSPFVIIQAVFLFLIFARLSFKSKIINWCAKSCFAIFLIHMHPAIKEIGYYRFTESLYDLPFFKHVVFLVILILSVFIASILIDKIRIIISDFCYKLLSKLYHCLPVKLITLDTYLPRQIIEIIK